MPLVTSSSNNPAKKKQVLLISGFSAVLLALILVAAWVADTKSKDKVEQQKSSAIPGESVDINVPGQQLSDKDVWRGQESSKIEDLRQQLDSMREQLEKGEFTQPEPDAGMPPNDALSGSRALSNVPMPPPPMGSQAGDAMRQMATNAFLNTPPGQSGSQATQGPIPEPRPITVFNLDVVSKEPVAPIVSPEQPKADPKPKAEKIADSADYIPAASFARVVLLAGLDAPTGGNAQQNPHPMLMRVVSPAQLPNRYKNNLKDCFITANAYGDISSERAYARLDRMSCIDAEGRAIDIPIKGYIVGEDGKAGIRGRLVSKQGQLLANAFLAGVGSGMGQAFKDSATTTSMSALGSTQTVNGGQEVKAGLGYGVGNSMEMLAKYYIKLAEQIFPVIEIGAGRSVDVVFTTGVALE